VDDELRRLEREALAGDADAQARLEAARTRAGKRKEHTGTWSYHDDDCWCVMAGGDRYCNRGGSVWSCCGSCKEASECSKPHLHPTYWSHPKSSQTHAGYAGNWPTYKSDAEIRAVAPEAFEA
jgi:hypothetical protein